MGTAAHSASKAPTSLKVEVYFLSRDYRVIFGVLAAILLVGLLLAMKTSGSMAELGAAEWSEVDPGRVARPLDQLQTLLQQPVDPARPDDLRANEVAVLLWAVDTTPDREQRKEQWEKAQGLIATSALSPASRQLYQEFGKSMASLTRLPSATLLTLAWRQQLPAANYLTALLYLRRNDKERAQFFLKREAVFPQSALSRRMALGLALEARDVPTLEELAADQVYRYEWTPAASTVLALEKGDWIGGAVNVFRQQWLDVDGRIVVLALISGGVWFLIWLQAIQMREARATRLTLCALATVLGLLSTTPTLVLDAMTGRYLGLTLGNGFWGDVAYYLLGVGPREELMKWLAVLPLVPALLRRRNRLEMLMVPGFVGLGFAVGENFAYFSEYAAAAYVRFLTANFFHVAATALLGLSFMEAYLNPRRLWWLFPLCFLEVSALHGVYDVFMAVEGLEALQVISSMAFVVLALRFFRKLRQFRSLETNYFWMPASILVGLAVVMAATMVEASARTGFGLAMVVLGYHAITFGMMIYLFIWQTRNLRYDANL